MQPLARVRRNRATLRSDLKSQLAGNQTLAVDEVNKRELRQVN